VADSINSKTTYYYVLRSVYTPFDGVRRAYYLAPRKQPYSNIASVLEGAQRFATPGDAINNLQNRHENIFSNDMQLVRVEETTEPGTTSIVEVPLGDIRQTGVVVKQGSDYWTGAAVNDRDKYAADISKAGVFRNLTTLVERLQRAVDQGMAPISSPVFVGIATVTTEPKVTRNEIVLA
jgi:hypothetical protein